MNEQNVKKTKAKKTPWQIIKKVCSSILLIICALLLVVAGWLCIDKFVLKSPVPSFCGFSSLTVTTGSMSGSIEIGDIIVIQKTNDYEIGDVITFLPEGFTTPTTHRIINYGETEGTYVTKGDANNAEDTEDVTEDQIFGEMVLHLPILGMFVGWVKDGGGLIYVIAVILILGIGSYMLNNEKKMALLREQNAPAEEKPVEDTPVEEAPTSAEEPKTEDAPEEQGKE